jgi:hypothetical protein
MPISGSGTSSSQRPSPALALVNASMRASRYTSVPGAGSRAGRLQYGGAALLAQLVEHLHGKEGVNGSSPLEGFSEAPAQQLLLLSVEETFWSGGVHETSTAPNVDGSATAGAASLCGFAGSAATST